MGISSRRLFILLIGLNLVLMICFNTAVQASLVLPFERTTGLGCIPEGMTVSYECTVTDPVSPPVATTVWLGTALNCPSATDTSNNRITLDHMTFLSDVADGDCGDLSAMSIGFNGNNYSSRLTLTNTTGLNGMTVICTLSGGNVIGNDTIKIGASPPPPQNVIVGVTSMPSITINWTQPFDTSNVEGYIFTVTGEDCGCESINVNASTTSVSCSRWMVNGQTCSFEVRTVSKDCGFISDSVPDAITSVVLSAPLSPSQLSLGNLKLSCSFQSTNAVLSWMASSAISSYPPIQMYLVTVNNGPEMSTTGTETNITVPGSTFPGAGTYSFSLRAINILGRSAPLMADLDVALTIVSSSYTVTRTNATLTFSLSNTRCVGSASVTVYYQNCSDQVNCECSQTFTTNQGSTSDTEALVITDLRAGVIYCYRSEVMNAGSIVGFENGRTFRTLPPVPPTLLDSARLVSSDPPTYQCVSSAEGFNGESLQITASFDPVTGLYSVPPCSIFVWLIVVIVILVVLLLIVGVTVGVVLVVCLVKKHKETADDVKDIAEKTSPTSDSLYADPKSIEHEAAPGTEDQYAMVDRKGKKNTKPKPTPPEALYQDPNTIEHETAASGDTYAVVDKPKRSSKKKGGPDVVPPPSEGLTYADIDLSSKRPKPGSGRQAPQQPGEYPKEHPVEYSSVDHGNTSQL